MLPSSLPQGCRILHFRWWGFLTALWTKNVVKYLVFWQSEKQEIASWCNFLLHLSWEWGWASLHMIKSQFHWLFCEPACWSLPSHFRSTIALDYKESWALRNWCFRTVVLEKSPESPLGCKVIQPVHPKGNQSWIFIGRTDAEAETPTLWPHDAQSWLIWKDPDAGKDWRQENGTTEDEMFGWHHQLNGHQ